MSDDDDGGDLFSHRYFFFKTCKFQGKKNIEAQECSVQTFKFISLRVVLGALLILQREQLPTIQVLFELTSHRRSSLLLQPRPAVLHHVPSTYLNLSRVFVLIVKKKQKTSKQTKKTQ